MTLSNELDDIQAIRSNYFQGWLYTRLDADIQKQMVWKPDSVKNVYYGAVG